MVKKKKYIHRVLFMQPVKQMVTWIFSTSIICAIVIVLDLNGIIKVRIQTSVFIGFASLIAGISGTVGAIMVGFIISKLQAIESDRQLWYIELKHELKEMRDVLHSLVYEYFQLCEPLDKCIQYLESLDIRTDLFAAKLDWDTIQKPSRLAFNDADIDVKNKDVYTLIQSIVHVEEYIGELRVSWVASNVVGSLLRDCSNKLFALLLISLGLMAFFAISDAEYSFDSYLFLVLIVTLLIYIGVVLVEIIIHTNDFVRNVNSSNNGKMDDLELRD